MKHIYLILISIVILMITGAVVSETSPQKQDETHELTITAVAEKDTCIIEGQAFKMKDYFSTKLMRAYIKNSQIYVVNEGLQFAKYRITQYVFSSLTDENMPSFRYFNQRLSPPILQILKNARVGEQYLFEEIVIVDESNKLLTNEVRPLMIERVKN
jgi:hypothetical protein